jgi:hypothetical protein
LHRLSRKERNMTCHQNPDPGDEVQVRLITLGRFLREIHTIVGDTVFQL